MSAISPDSPTLFHIEDDVLANPNFRKVVWTGLYAQLVYMSLEPHETIDMEVHPHVDQFFRLEQGLASVEGGAGKLFDVVPNDAFFIPAGTRHLIRAGSVGAKLYTIYSPPNHPPTRIQRSKPVESREKEEEDEHSLTTSQMLRILGRIV